MGDSHRLIIFIEDREKNPYEVWLLAALLMSGSLFLFGLSPDPPSIEASLPETSRLIWNIQLVSGTFAALIGMFWKQPTISRTIQMAGHLWTGSGAFIYTCVLFYYNGLAATLTGLVLGSVVIAALVKTLQLRRQVKHILQKAKEKNGAYDTNTFNGGDCSAT